MEGPAHIHDLQREDKSAVYSLAMVRVGSRLLYAALILVWAAASCTRADPSAPSVPASPATPITRATAADSTAAPAQAVPHDARSGDTVAMVSQPPTPGLPASPNGQQWASHQIDLPAGSQIAVDLKPGQYVGQATVIGQPGTVPPGSNLVVFDQQLGRIARIVAGPAGEFDATVDALPGSHVFVGIGFAPGDSGVLVPTPPRPFPYTIGAGRMEDGPEGAPWILTTSLISDELRKGETVPFEGTIILPYAPWADPPDGTMELLATILIDANGRQVGYGAEFVSPFLTPTGLPIERSVLDQVVTRSISKTLDVHWRVNDEGTWLADIAGEITMPASWGDGLYRLTAELSLNDRFQVDGEFAGIGLCCEAPVRNVLVGEVQAPQLAATLFADVLDEGSRGGVKPTSQEDWFDVSGRIAIRHDPVIPRADADDRAWTYDLVPYLPMLGAVSRRPAALPPTTFDFPTSSLTVRVHRPDGRTATLGPAPLSHLEFRVPRPPACYSAGEISSGGYPSGLVRIGAPREAFAYQFPVDGDYRIVLDGAVTDMDGVTYDLSGEYRITVGQPLKLGLGFLPGTPFQTGNQVPLTAQIWPAMPASVEFSALHVEPDGTRHIQRFHGTATDHGRWDAGTEVLAFETPGEYRIDVEARYQDPEGHLWVGRLRTGSVVFPLDSEIAAHGRRAIGTQRQWFFRPDFDPPIDLYGTDSGYNIVGDGLMWPPFANGDIQWGVTEDRNDNAIAFRGGVQVLAADSRLASAAAQQALSFAVPLFDGLSVQDQIAIGQMPLVTYADAASGLPGTHPDEISLWAYLYSSAQRPDVRVRELIQGSEVVDTYWLFDDPYYLQTGVGPEGDLPTDYKFLYTAAVIHDRKTGEAAYAAHGSLWVLTPDDDSLGARVFPPFRGAAGGPDGGPLFSVHGREVDQFFLPIGVRPSSVLQVGESFRMAGPVAPTLPSLLQYTVTAPSGAQRHFEGRANPIGFFYRAEQDFVIDEPGVWTVEVHLTHDGPTSPGPVGPPFPTGGVLSPDLSTYRFVATDNNTLPLSVTTDLQKVSPSSWLCHNVKEATFEAQLPAGADAETAFVSVSIPGTVLVESNLPVVDRTVQWRLDAVALSSLAESFDVDRGIGDLITITFHVDGLLNGQPARWVGRIFTAGTRVLTRPTL